MSTPINPFAHELMPYPCPACRRQRRPSRDADPTCPRCGADLSLNDAVRLDACALRARGLRALGSNSEEAERALRASLLLDPHPATRNALAVAASRTGRHRALLACIRESRCPRDGAC